MAWSSWDSVSVVLAGVDVSVSETRTAGRPSSTRGKVRAASIGAPQTAVVGQVCGSQGAPPS